MPNLVPNYLTTDAAGNVGADFNGRLHAAGIDIDAGIGGKTDPPNTIRWERTSDGAVIADIGSLEYLGAGPQPRYQSRIRTFDPAGTVAAELDATVLYSGKGIVGASARTKGVQLIDDTGSSSFLQLATTAKRTVNFGLDNVSWPGGVVMSTTKTIAHGLGVMPVAVVATMNASGQGQVIACHTGNWTVTNFDVQAQFVQGFAPGASSVPVAWVAIG